MTPRTERMTARLTVRGSSWCSTCCSFICTISSNPCHVLRHYFHQREHTGHNLRPRVHNFALPKKDDRNFISRVLYGVL